MGHIEVLIEKKKTAVIPKCKVDPAVALTITKFYKIKGVNGLKKAQNIKNLVKES